MSTRHVNEEESRQRLAHKLENILQQACLAEERLDYVEAERLFGLALLCEANIRQDVNDARVYVQSTKPVYVWTVSRPVVTDEQLMAI